MGHGRQHSRDCIDRESSDGAFPPATGFSARPGSPTPGYALSGIIRPVDDARSDRGVPVLSVLGDAEKAAVLNELVAADTGLRDRAEIVARRSLASVDPATVSDTVVEALTTLDQDALATRAGRTRYGYVEPTEAAWALLEEALGPWIEDIARLSRVGLEQAARQTALGILGGLQRCQQHTRHDDRLLSWAPDFPAEASDRVLRGLADAGAQLSDAELESVTAAR